MIEKKNRLLLNKTILKFPIKKIIDKYFVYMIEDKKLSLSNKKTTFAYIPQCPPDHSSHIWTLQLSCGLHIFKVPVYWPPIKGALWDVCQWSIWRGQNKQCHWGNDHSLRWCNVFGNNFMHSECWLGDITYHSTSWCNFHYAKPGNNQHVKGWLMSTTPCNNMDLCIKCWVLCMLVLVVSICHSIYFF